MTLRRIRGRKFGGEVLFLALFSCLQMESAPAATSTRLGDGHDFDFLIGDWKAHARQLPDRLNGSHVWIEYTGTEHHRKLLDSNTNIEEFEVFNTEKHLHLHAQTLRLYDTKARQWKMYLVDVYSGALDGVPLVGRFSNGRGEFFRQAEYMRRSILMRYVWFNLSSKSARMEQSYSDDGGKTWELNWICELTR